MLVDEGRCCRETGIMAHDSFLDPSGTLRALIEVQLRRTSPNETVNYWMSSNVPEFRKVRRTWTIESKTRHAMVVHGEFAALLGLKKHYRSVVVRYKPEREAIGNVVRSR